MHAFLGVYAASSTQIIPKNICIHLQAACTASDLESYSAKSNAWIYVKAWSLVFFVLNKRIIVVERQRCIHTEIGTY